MQAFKNIVNRLSGTPWSKVIISDEDQKDIREVLTEALADLDGKLRESNFPKVVVKDGPNDGDPSH